MANQTNSTDRLSDEQTSPLLAMHARYENAWEEYNAIDEAHTRTAKDELCLRTQYQDAMLSNQIEVDALRLAILYQVPVTWVEAMILQYHIHIINDLADTPREGDRAALAIAIETLFDFMCCEIEQDHATIGDQFQTSANLVFVKRRYRTGGLEA